MPLLTSNLSLSPTLLSMPLSPSLSMSAPMPCLGWRDRQLRQKDRTWWWVLGGVVLLMFMRDGNGKGNGKGKGD
jgi:hypothetical protein